jgi:hypothetical protein
MTFEAICWIGLAIMAGCAVFMVWLVFYVTRAPVMELHCPRCGVVHGYDYDDNGNCLTCGLPVELCNKKGGGA